MDKQPISGLSEQAPDKVVADPLRFKQRLRIGDDAYAILRAKKRIVDVWDTAGAAATGAGVASSSFVAGTFFAPTGLMASLGLAGAAVTPIGWVVAAGVIAGGGYYGLARLMNSGTSSLTDTIPKFINTPIDILGAGLLDLYAALAVRVSAVDGDINQRELDAVLDHLAGDWGYDRAFAEQTLTVLVSNADHIRIKPVAIELAQFLEANPDCSAEIMLGEVLEFLRELVVADGAVDEREEFAIDAIETTFRDARRLTSEKAGRALKEWSSEASAKLAEAGRGAGTLLGQAANHARTLVRRD